MHDAQVWFAAVQCGRRFGVQDSRLKEGVECSLQGHSRHDGCNPGASVSDSLCAAKSVSEYF
jgi:hypothetical protein